MYKSGKLTISRFFVCFYLWMMWGQVPLQEERCGEATTLLLRIPAG